ncbi:PRC-barrel domain-containing protein [Gordonia sp. PS3]|uniref:PRC-barrel domain-containing protein n=1 Tax=Gordonia TaxID=2053 RepID=UPI0024180104|nr:PRC-barrel domain-containing protein [Gordonia sihwensis]WFN92860.1 PRC-barrel domain-containing protein [Gordonia sihwensis]
MRASTLLGTQVRCDGRSIGRVMDVRLREDDGGALLIAGLVVGLRPRASFFGSYRFDGVRPSIIARLLRWRERGSRLIPWCDVVSVDDDVVTVRPGAD